LELGETILAIPISSPEKPEKSSKFGKTPQKGISVSSLRSWLLSSLLSWELGEAILEIPISIPEKLEKFKTP
jgi:hypothetical protein